MWYDAEPDGRGVKRLEHLEQAARPLIRGGDNGGMCKAGKGPGKQGTGGPRRKPGGPVTADTLSRGGGLDWNRNSLSLRRMSPTWGTQ